jgi:plastocyanin
MRTALRTHRSSDPKPLAGVNVGDPEGAGYASVNEFFPQKLSIKVGRPVTWKIEGIPHTVSFNVPAYFPVFTIDKKGDVHYDKRAQDPVKWTVPEAQSDDEGNDIPRAIDAGKWDGGGGFHSTGLLSDGDTFSLAFTKPGTYPYACAIHPQMIGQVVVSA